LSAHQVRSSSRCSSTTDLSVIAPALLAVGGFLAIMALVVRLATTGVGPRAPRPRWALFMTLWTLVIMALAGSALAMYVATAFKVCVEALS
jgi:hypothetical protein